MLLGRKEKKRGGRRGWGRGWGGGRERVWEEKLCKVGRKRTWLQRSGVLQYAGTKYAFVLFSLNVCNHPTSDPAFSRFSGTKVYILKNMEDLCSLTSLTFFIISISLYIFAHLLLPSYFRGRNRVSHFQGHDSILSHLFSLSKYKQASMWMCVCICPCWHHVTIPNTCLHLVFLFF